MFFIVGQCPSVSSASALSIFATKTNVETRRGTSLHYFIVIFKNVLVPADWFSLPKQGGPGRVLVWGLGLLYFTNPKSFSWQMDLPDVGDENTKNSACLPL